jgi:CRP-like cAMP-binding protein
MADLNLLEEDDLFWREEGLFARDEEGRLIRARKAELADLNKRVSLTIDGNEVVMPKAVPATNEQGRELKDDEGNIKPRLTTIHDAVSKLYRDRLRKPNPVPLLCHREYMEPVGVCRVCVVQISRMKKSSGKFEVDPKLTPSCKRFVEDGMIVHTLESPDEQARGRVRHSVEMLVELLMCDHPTPCAKEAAHAGDCELEALAQRFHVVGSRFQACHSPSPAVPLSSPVINVDLNACILCDRCIRGCNNIKQNQVIGRAGKGANAHIAFDLDTPMGSSTCVACGECMISCPTGALTHVAAIVVSQPPDTIDGPGSSKRRKRHRKKPTGDADLRQRIENAQENPQISNFNRLGDVSEDSLLNHPIKEIREAFEGVAPAFLRWNAKAVWRRHYPAGTEICREGEYGSTAFLIERGSVDIFIGTLKNGPARKRARGFFGSSGWSRTAKRPQGADARAIPSDSPVSLSVTNPQAAMGVGELFGEMACLNRYPRAATVVAREDCTVLEMMRNVLYIMQRSPKYRKVLEKKYAERSIENHLMTVGLFDPLRGDETKFKAFIQGMLYAEEQAESGERIPQVHLVRYEPGEVILRQGDEATDGFYLVRTGFVKITRREAGGEQAMTYVGPGGHIGEIGLLSELPEIRPLAPHGRRTATCTAMDHVELVRIEASNFARILNDPQFKGVRKQIVEEARRRLESNLRTKPETGEADLPDYINQGLYNAQSLLVLDLEKCTRCDECTKACSTTHLGIPRLIREGLRFDKYLVASSCRSCTDPVCMIGCPVDAIHRPRNSNHIAIDDHCIGCGLCERNCPYGSINMVAYDERGKLELDPGPGDRRAATTCDLCTSLGSESVPRCVYACPHDAAHRVSGPKLYELVTGLGIGDAGA